ncbi:MAG: hypothetical protein JXR48_09185 [Candidatus Delongbacteria bacterium]|nr:hypothetical protein [Candidatus Delongbacteria bacterium]
MVQPIQTQPIQTQTKPEHEIDLIEIITVLWRARKLIAIVISVSLISAILYILFTPKLYSGTITLYPAQQGASSPMAQMAKQMGMGRVSSGDTNYNIPDVVTSRTLSEQIVSHKWDIDGFDGKVDLVRYFDKIWEIESSSNINNKQDEIEFNQSKIYNYSQFIAKNRISVNSNVKTGLISVSVMMENPKLARDIANFISVFVSDWVNNTEKDRIIKI